MNPCLPPVLARTVLYKLSPTSTAFPVDKNLEDPYPSLSENAS